MALSIEERRKLIKEQLVISTVNPSYTGGQSVGSFPVTIVGTHEDLGVKIEISHYKSNHRNKELVQTLFDLVIDELIK